MTNSTMVGLGLTMEGIFQNEVIYEFMMENAYRPKPTDISAWYDVLVCLPIILCTGWFLGVVGELCMAGTLCMATLLSFDF